MMYSYLIVMAGGAIGAALRYSFSRAIPSVEGSWPWPTFAVNILGSLLMGLLACWVLKKGASGEPLRLLLGVGLLGGFTTFSAFSLELVQLIERQQIVTACVYAASSVGLAVCGLFAGLALGRGVIA
jgi:fluoride exporter